VRGLKSPEAAPESVKCSKLKIILSEYKVIFSDFKLLT